MTMKVAKAVTPVGKFLRKKRIERALTQEEVAKLAGCSRSTISNIEIRKTEIPRYTRNLLIGALKLTSNEIKEFDTLLADADIRERDHSYGYKRTSRKPNISDDLTLAVTHIIQYLNVGQKSEIYRFLRNDLGLN